MNSEISYKIAAWLSSLGHSNVQPLTLAIFNQRFPACRYTVTTPITPGCRAYDEGQRESVDVRIYCAGVRPKQMRQQMRPYGRHGEWESKHCYRLPDSSLDWYVCCHMDKAPEAGSQFAPAHPFGPSFILSAWEVPSGESIDHYHYAESKCMRVSVGIAELPAN